MECDGSQAATESKESHMSPSEAPPLTAERGLAWRIGLEPFWGDG